MPALLVMSEVKGQETKNWFLAIVYLSSCRKKVLNHTYVEKDEMNFQIGEILVVRIGFKLQIGLIVRNSVS